MKKQNLFCLVCNLLAVNTLTGTYYSPAKGMLRPLLKPLAKGASPLWKPGQGPCPKPVDVSTFDTTFQCWGFDTRHIIAVNVGPKAGIEWSALIEFHAPGKGGTNGWYSKQFFDSHRWCKVRRKWWERPLDQCCKLRDRAKQSLVQSLRMPPLSPIAEDEFHLQLTFND